MMKSTAWAATVYRSRVGMVLGPTRPPTGRVGVFPARREVPSAAALLAELGGLERGPVAWPLLLGEEGDLSIFVGLGRVRRTHRALPLEDHPFVNDEAGGRHVAEHLAGGSD